MLRNNADAHISSLGYLQFNESDCDMKNYA